jgi:hypothetical protein
LRFVLKVLKRSSNNKASSCPALRRVVKPRHTDRLQSYPFAYSSSLLLPT